MKAPGNGIWGLAYPPLSAWGGPTPFASIVSELEISNVFSMCLEETNPVMSLGIDYSSNNNFEWTPLVQEDYYQGKVFANYGTVTEIFIT